jgi:putative oxidoreductase
MPLELPEGFATALLILGRILLGGFFVLGGVSHFSELTPVSGAMQARGVPFARTTLLVGTFWQIVFGALLMVGLFTTLSALALVAFTVAATIMMLNFWDHPKGELRDTLYRGFQGNVAVVGGLLIAAA